jgi:tyrosyl-tRNA synthetase
MTDFPPVREQMAILMRGVEFGDDRTRTNMEAELRLRLKESRQNGRPLRVYCGFDPTSSDLHLGHTVPLRKLRQFQDLGHTVIFLIGTFTGTIGDPSDKESARTQQSLEEAMANARGFTQQAHRVLDPEKTVIDYNHRWLSELDFGDVIRLASHFTVQQFLARDNFSKRHATGEPIWLHEFFYALMQGYDAIMLDTDVQVGGTDQLFNLMAGRTLMNARGLRPQVVLTFPILVGTDGHRRMSKSTGNHIGIDEPPAVIFTKVVNLPDHTFRNFAELVTRWNQEEIDRMVEQVEAGEMEPQAAKRALGQEIVGIFHGEDKAMQAAVDAVRMHEGAAPSDAPQFSLSQEMNLLDLMSASGMVRTKGEARRLIQQGGVRLNGETVADGVQTSVSPNGGESIIQVGKKRFLRVVSAE